jgi:hypothetical protein
MASRDEMRRIHLLASVLGYHEVSQLAKKLQSADPPVLPEYRQNLTNTLLSAQQTRTEHKEAVSKLSDGRMRRSLSKEYSERGKFRLIESK